MPCCPVLFSQHVYIDPAWVAAEYLKRCKKGSWKKDTDVEGLKDWNLGRFIEAELFNKPSPDDLTMEEFVAGEVEEEEEGE